MNNKVRLSNCKRGKRSPLANFNEIKEKALSKKEVIAFWEYYFLAGQINEKQKKVMWALTSFWNLEGIFPTYKTISETAEVSLSTVIRTCKEMWDRGLLYWVNRRQKHDRRQTSNKYIFTIYREKFLKIKTRAKTILRSQKKALSGKFLEIRGFLRMSGGNTRKAYYNKYNRESPFKTTKQREDEKAQKQAEKVSQKNLFQRLWEVLNRGNLEEIDRFQQANIINGLTPLQQLQKIDFKDYQKARSLALKCFPAREHRTPSEKPTSKIPSIAELEAQIQEKERQKRLGKNYHFNAFAVCPL